MFIPPPSSLPPSQKPAMDSIAAPQSRRQNSPRTRWSILILLVPLVLVIITLSTRFTAHPAFFDALAGISDDILVDSRWDLHKRHPLPQQNSLSFSVVTSLGTLSSSLVAVSSTASSFSTSPSNVPSIPSNPVLPIPFPQPFDTSFSSNFSTISCLNFFTNMTDSAPFRQCRSFGLLEYTSSAFFNAQSNITLLNDIVWGTCNMAVSFPQCIANMNWFAQSLKSNCAADLANNNVPVSETLNGLLIYSLMRQVGCQSNSSTNVYCYVSAVVNTNPSDFYIYDLPYGYTLLNNTTPSCSPCTKANMGLYLAAASGQDPNTTDPTVKATLAKSYASASQLLNNVCGTGYVQTLTSNGVHMSTFSYWYIFGAAFVVSFIL